MRECFIQSWLWVSDVGWLMITPRLFDTADGDDDVGS
jgi:hypothetical protein